VSAERSPIGIEEKARVRVQNWEAAEKKRNRRGQRWKQAAARMQKAWAWV
jgi:hypothetical protein